MNKRDQISSQYFNQQGIKLRLNANADDSIFDFSSNVEMLARLTGAPDNSEIHVSQATDCLIFRVHNPAVFKFPSEYALFNEESGFGFKLLVDSIYVRPELQDMGIGTRSVMICIKEAKALGLSHVALDAAGSGARPDLFFGYRVWPSMGFDAPLPTELLKQLPASLSGARLLSDLMQDEEGRQWWYDNGSSIEVEFELRDGSVSWELLHDYATQKRIFI